MTATPKITHEVTEALRQVWLYGGAFYDRAVSERDLQAARRQKLIVSKPGPRTTTYVPLQLTASGTTALKSAILDRCWREWMTELSARAISEWSAREKND
jgi:hypothetical protein